MMSATVLTSCSDDEDTSPSNAEVNAFAPAAADNSATAQLQREFYNETGIRVRLHTKGDGRKEPGYAQLNANTKVCYGEICKIVVN